MYDEAFAIKIIFAIKVIWHTRMHAILGILYVPCIIVIQNCTLGYSCFAIH